MRFLSITLNFCQLSPSATGGLTGSSITLPYLAWEERVLTPRHVGIFLVLQQRAGRKTDFQKYPTRGKGGEPPMKMPFVLQAIFGMLLMATAPLSRGCDQETRTVCEHVRSAAVTQLVQRASASVCPSRMNNKYFTTRACMYCIRIQGTF